MFKKITSIFLIIGFVFTNTAQAQNRGISLLRDAEIELIIRAFTDPILIAAELDPEAVQTHLVNDKTLNAFVIPGNHMFLNSGLLLRAENLNQVLGVVAHETGHITSNHFARRHEGSSQFLTYSLLGALVGVAAMAAGAGDAGMAAIMGGQHIGIRRMLRFSRNQESEADKAGLEFLKRTKQSGRGLIDFLEILGDQELVPEKYQDPYARTHPITSIRVGRLYDDVLDSPYADAETDPELEAKFQRLQAKLYGYLKPLHATLVKYPVEDKSINARYARTFAYQQKKMIDDALVEISELIEMEPENPFFHETKGQILFENGRISESLSSYELAVKYYPESPLLRVAYAQSLINMEDDQYIEEAIENLEAALLVDPLNSFGWRQASVAYHRNNDEGLRHYASAQHFLISGDIRGAMINAKRAVDLLPENTPKWIKAQDIMVITEANMGERAQKAKEEQEKREQTNRQNQRKQNRYFSSRY